MDLLLAFLLIYGILTLLSLRNNAILKIIWIPFLLIIFIVIEVASKRKLRVDAEGGSRGYLGRLISLFQRKYPVIRKLSDDEKNFKIKYRILQSTDPIAYDLKLIEYFTEKNSKDKLVFYYNILDHKILNNKNILILFISLFIPLFIAASTLLANGLNLYVMLFVEDSYKEYKIANSANDPSLDYYKDQIFDIYINFLNEIYKVILVLPVILILTFMILFLFFSSFHFKHNRYLLLLKTAITK